MTKLYNNCEYQRLQNNNSVRKNHFRTISEQQPLQNNNSGRKPTPVNVFHCIIPRRVPKIQVLPHHRCVEKKKAALGVFHKILISSRLSLLYYFSLFRYIYYNYCIT